MSGAFVGSGDFAPDVFNLSAFTVGTDPEVMRGRLVSREPGAGAFAWPEIELWMRRAGLVALQVAVHFDGSTPTMAQWIDEGGRRLWVDVAAERPAVSGTVAWGLALIRNCDVVLRALSRYFGIDPAPLVPRTVEEAALEAAGSEPIPRDVTLVVLPERVKPASRARLWEALELLVRNDIPAFHQRWRDLDGASLVALQAAGVREVERWVSAARLVTPDDDPHDRVLQAVHLMVMGRPSYDGAVRSPGRYLDHWPENAGEELLTLFGIP